MDPKDEDEPNPNLKKRVKAVKNFFNNDVERRRNRAVWGLVSSTGLSYAEVLKIWNEEE